MNDPVLVDVLLVPVEAVPVEAVPVEAVPVDAVPVEETVPVVLEEPELVVVAEVEPVVVVVPEVVAEELEVVESSSQDPKVAELALAVFCLLLGPLGLSTFGNIAATSRFCDA